MTNEHTASSSRLETPGRVVVRTPGAPTEYAVEIGAGALTRTGEMLRASLARDGEHGNRLRVAIVSNKRVFKLYGDTLAASLRESGFESHEIFIGDGERFKTLGVAARVLDRLAELKFDRSDIVLALGGGVTGDLAGFAAATHLRGVRFVNVPTTLLAQIDASIGGKTGVNSSAGKNLIGVFHHPRLVIVDVKTIRTLDARDLTAGWCEAVKHGAAGDAALFRDTTEHLALRRSRSNSDAATTGDDDAALAELIRRHIAFKAAIVAGDERESVDRVDAHSRRILNFGHTIAHALESATDYRRFRHGEAVGRGMIAAAAISRELGLLDEDSFKTLCDAVRLTGRIPTAADLDVEDIFSRHTSDKKSVSGSIKWVLIDRIGHARITDSRSIPPAVIRRAIRLASDLHL